MKINIKIDLRIPTYLTEQLMFTLVKNFFEPIEWKKWLKTNIVNLVEKVYKSLSKYVLVS